jgi:hypothetical protein
MLTRFFQPSATVCLTNLSWLMNDEAFFMRLPPSDRARLRAIFEMILLTRNMRLAPNWAQDFSSISDMFCFSKMIRRYKCAVMTARKLDFIHTHLSEAEAAKLLCIAKRRAQLGILLRGFFNFPFVGCSAYFECVTKNDRVPLSFRMMFHGAHLAVHVWSSLEKNVLEYATASEAKSILVEELRSQPDGLQKSATFWTVLGSGWEFLFGSDHNDDGYNPIPISCDQLPSSSLEKASLQLATRRDPALFIWTQCAFVSLVSLSGWLVSSILTTIGTTQEPRKITSTAVAFVSSLGLVSVIRYLVEARKHAGKRRIARHASQICWDAGNHGYKLSPWSPVGWKIFLRSAVNPLSFQTSFWP